LARALCSAELEALARAAERDDGNYSGQPTTPMLVKAEPLKEPEKALSIKRLWSEYAATSKQAGFIQDGGRRHAVAVQSLRKFLKHDDARKITKKNVLDWGDELMKTLAAKTVSDVYLSTVRTLFS
jgi:hypothetical protein